MDRQKHSTVDRDRTRPIQRYKMKHILQYLDKCFIKVSLVTIISNSFDFFNVVDHSFDFEIGLAVAGLTTH